VRVAGKEATHGQTGVGETGLEGRRRQARAVGFCKLYMHGGLPSVFVARDAWNPEADAASTHSSQTAIDHRTISAAERNGPSTWEDGGAPCARQDERWWHRADAQSANCWLRVVDGVRRPFLMAPAPATTRRRRHAAGPAPEAKVPCRQRVPSTGGASFNTSSREWATE